MPALVFQNLGIDLGPRKLVLFRVDRTDIPHLTMSWGNPSGEIDIHLTPAKPKDAADRVSIAKFMATDVEGYLTSLGAEFVNFIRDKFLPILWPVRGDWLRQNNYKLLQARGESFEQWLRRSAPKSRGKHRVDAQVLRAMPKYGLAHATTRRLAELKGEQQVWALCASGWDKGHILVLQYSTWTSGRRTWLAADYEDASDIAREMDQFFAGRFKGLIAGMAKVVYEAFHLDELGF